MKIVLGSESREMKKILEDMGIKFEAVPVKSDQKITGLRSPQDLALSIAKAKAFALRSMVSDPAIFIASGQVVVCNGEIMGIPRSQSQARHFLRRYNAYPVEIITAVVTTNLSAGRIAKRIDIAKVYFSPFSEEEISDIVKEKEVFERVGGFLFWNEQWIRHIRCIEGSVDSVMGLPKKITQMLIVAVA